MNNILLTVFCSFAATAAGAFSFLFWRYRTAIIPLRNENAALQRRQLHYELLTALTQNIGTNYETGVLIRNALMMIALSMQAGHASLARFNREDNTLIIEHEWSDPKLKPFPRAKINFSKESILYETFMIKGDVYLICNKLDLQSKLIKELALDGLRSCIFVPIIIAGNIWGIMTIGRHSDETEWKKKDARGMILTAGAMVSLLVKAEAEKALIEAKEQAQSSDRAKTNFVSRMSHEMRTPMNAIIGMATIAKNSDDQSRVKYCLSRISEASLHLLGIINDILDMGKIEAGKFELSPVEFELLKMLKHVKSMIEFRINEKCQEFVFNPAPNLPFCVIADEQRLIQVLINILSNAVKFTPENGIINFDVQVTDTPPIIRFRIKDTGIGIKEDQKNHLFSPFNQADSSITRRFGGTGLGLAISKNIIEQMGGSISLESEYGKGAVFTIDLPLEEGKRLKEEINAKKKVDFNDLDNIFYGKVILVAEDIEINREIIQLLLEDTCIAIDYAKDGLDAVRMFRADYQKYDLILSDIHMPEMDGFQATKKIREFEAELYASSAQRRQVPIIAMTANVFREDIEKCIAAGMNDHIGKPVEISELIRKLQKHLFTAGKSASY
ncbi:MAG: response regulator [Treponema sp.]|nr:response regulator [Treponema sp.]